MYMSNIHTLRTRIKDVVLSTHDPQHRQEHNIQCVCAKCRVPYRNHAYNAHNVDVVSGGTPKSEDTK